MPTSPSKPLRKLLNKPVLLVAAVGAIALAGGATMALWPKNQEKLVAELAQKSPEELRRAVESGAVPREVAWEAFAQAREAEMQKRIDGYFALSKPLDRQRYLDKLIDETLARQREWEQRAATRPARSEWMWRFADGQLRREGDRGPTSQPSEERRRQMEQRRALRADSTPPAERARRVEFMAAMRKRMQERGIQPPGGPGGFGGPGRGFFGGPGGSRDGAGRSPG